jgi:hypothetical protein
MVFYIVKPIDIMGVVLCCFLSCGDRAMYVVLVN